MDEADMTVLRKAWGCGKLPGVLLVTFDDIPFAAEHVARLNRLFTAGYLAPPEQSGWTLPEGVRHVLHYRPTMKTRHLFNDPGAPPKEPIGNLYRWMQERSYGG